MGDNKLSEDSKKGYSSFKRFLKPYRKQIYSLFATLGVFSSLVLMLYVVNIRKQTAAPENTMAYGNTYYVATTGSDSNNGSSSYPFRTIQKAAYTAASGDTIIVRNGIYNERVVIYMSGSSNAPITIKADAGATVNMYGFEVYANYVKVEGFNIDGGPVKVCDWGAKDFGIISEGDYNEFRSNKVTNGGYGGIQVRGSSDHNLVENNVFYKNGNAGMDISGTYHQVINNEVYDTRVAPCNWPDVNGVYFFGKGHVFRGNYIHDINFVNNPVTGSNKPHIDAFQTFDNELPGRGPAHDILFEGNRISLMVEALSTYDTVYAFMWDDNDERSSNITIRNNLIEAWGGMNLYKADPINWKIINNTFRSSLNFTRDFLPKGIELLDGQGVEIRNNIFTDYSFLHISIKNTSDLVTGNNLFYNSNGSVPGLEGYSIRPSDLYKVNPQFVDLNRNLYLKTTSPAIDKGVAISGVTIDYKGTPRPQGSAYDIGAYEFVTSVTSTPKPTITTAITSTPRPTPTFTSGDIIVDNTSTGFRVNSRQDRWQTYTASGEEHYGGSHRYNRLIGGGDRATWTFRVSKPGRYNVYAWWYDGEHRPTDVPYTINHKDGSITVKVNQQKNGGRWNLLGTYRFDLYGSVFVTDRVSSGSDIVADAIRVLYIGS